MKTIYCDSCRKPHATLPEAIAYQKPADFFAVHPQERKTRIYLTADVCVIDDQHFLVRGVLPLPIIGDEACFEWGVWAQISESAFKRMIDLWDSNEAHLEPSFMGMLSGEIKVYPGSDSLEISVQLRSNNQRPLFTIIDITTELGIDQTEGITTERVHSFFQELMPHLFEEELGVGAHRPILSRFKNLVNRLFRLG